MSRSEPHVAVLEGAGWGPSAGAWSGPCDELRLTGGHGLATLETIDRFLDEQARRGRTTIGALGYELGRELEPRVGAAPASDLPIVVLRAFENGPTPRDPTITAPPSITPLEPLWSEREYTQRFERLQQWIRSGDVYQANLSVAFEAEIDGNPFALGRHLFRRHPVPFHAELDLGDFQVLSNSPERFLERTGSRLETTPIKGTRPRATDPDRDRRQLEELRSDPKERAEHLMIVDLERNDLGRLARPGTVRVTRFAEPASFATVHHLASTVRAEIDPTTPFSTVLRATFPGGSITGAPKIRAMQILATLEERPRGFFTGAIVVHRPNGDFVASLTIRTATIVGSRFRYAAGGGVVADSRADLEYAECLLKTRAVCEAVRTLR